MSSRREMLPFIKPQTFSIGCMSGEFGLWNSKSTPSIWANWVLAFAVCGVALSSWMWKLPWPNQASAIGKMFRSEPRLRVPPFMLALVGRRLVVQPCLPKKSHRAHAVSSGTALPRRLVPDCHPDTSYRRRLESVRSMDSSRNSVRSQPSSACKRDLMTRFCLCSSVSLIFSTVCRTWSASSCEEFGARYDWTPPRRITLSLATKRLHQECIRMYSWLHTDAQVKLQRAWTRNEQWARDAHRSATLPVRVSSQIMQYQMIRTVFWLDQFPRWFFFLARVVCAIHVQVTDRPSPDAPSLTQAIIVQMVYSERNLGRPMNSLHKWINVSRYPFGPVLGNIFNHGGLWTKHSGYWTTPQIQKVITCLGIFASLIPTTTDSTHLQRFESLLQNLAGFLHLLDEIVVLDNAKYRPGDGQVSEITEPRAENTEMLRRRRVGHESQQLVDIFSQL